MPEATRVKINGKRHYKVGDEAYPSVTNVTDEYAPKQKAVESWKRQTDDAEAVKSRAGLLGTLAHYRVLNDYAIRRIELPEIDLSEVDDQIETDIQTCEVMWEQCNFPVEDSPYIEEKVWSHEHEYAGTLDMLTDGTVVDLKTSKTAYDSHKLQISAYYHACKELPQMPDPDDAAIIVLNPDPESNPNLTPRVHRFSEPELEEHFATFLGVLETFKQKYGT